MESFTLSVTEAELVAATQCVQEMISIKKITESVKLLMIVEMGNEGAKELISNSSVGGQMQRMKLSTFFEKIERITFN
jgi:hypothetical protein